MGRHRAVCEQPAASPTTTQMSVGRRSNRQMDAGVATWLAHDGAEGAGDGGAKGVPGIRDVLEPAKQTTVTVVRRRFLADEVLMGVTERTCRWRDDPPPTTPAMTAGLLHRGLHWSKFRQLYA